MNLDTYSYIARRLRDLADSIDVAVSTHDAERLRGINGHLAEQAYVLARAIIHLPEEGAA